MIVLLAGFYMYIEGDSAIQGDPARLLSSACHYSGPVCLQFWYHMYGSATAMTLNMYLLQGNLATKIWSVKNNHGQEWHLGQVDINVFSPFQVSLAQCVDSLLIFIQSSFGLTLVIVIY